MCMLGLVLDSHDGGCSVWMCLDLGLGWSHEPVSVTELRTNT